MESVGESDAAVGNYHLKRALINHGNIVQVNSNSKVSNIDLIWQPILKSSFLFSSIVLSAQKNILEKIT